MDEQPKDFIAPIGQQKKKFNWGKIAAIIIVLTMVLWVFAIAIGDRDSSGGKEEKKPSNLIQVGSYEFYILEDYTFGTFLNAGDKKIPIAFRLDPRKAENISIDTSVVQKVLSAKKAYLTYNPNQKNLGKIAVAAAEISRITSIYKIPTTGAFMEDTNPVDPVTPIRTCADAGNTSVVIALLPAESETGITTDGNCINVKGKNADELILAADKLGMNLVGIRL